MTIFELQFSDTVKEREFDVRRHGRLRHRLPEVSTRCFFNSGVKYLQNSSRIQKISIKFAVVIGVSIICICLIFTYKGTKNISLLQLFAHFSYVELTFYLVQLFCLIRPKHFSPFAGSPTRSHCFAGVPIMLCCAIVNRISPGRSSSCPLGTMKLLPRFTVST